MSDLLHAAVAGAFRTLKSVAGVSATYRRGSQFKATTVVPGGTEVESEGRDGITMKVRVRSFMVEASCLSEFGDPAQGDVIEIEEDGERRRYVVAPLSAGGELFRPWPDRKQFRIHTKYQGTA